jgi:xylulokinase
VAVASVAEAGVLLDERGEPTADIIAWFDTRTRPQSEWLGETIGADTLFERSGLSLQPIFSLNKILWHRENEPDAFAMARLWLLIADYIAFRLCGIGATDYSLGSRTLMMHLSDKRWDERTLAEAGIFRDLLPPLVQGGTRLGPVTSNASQETGLPITTQVSAGGHDHVCGALAAGVTRPGQMLNSLGTAEAIFVPLATPLTDPRAGRQGYTQGALVTGGGYYVFGGQYTSGASVDWLRRLLGTADDPLAYDTLLERAASAPVGSLGAMFLPHLRMANPPYEDSRSRGALIGLTTEVGNEAAVRAVLEGLAFESFSTFEPLLEYPQVVAPTSVKAIGGGTKNDLLMSIKASVTGMDHHIIDAEEATALGAAMLGGIGAGIYASVDEAVGAMSYGQRTVSPDPEDAKAYRRIYRDVFRKIYPALAPLSHAIGEVQASIANRAGKDPAGE